MNPDDLRKMLRASDPARDREMSPLERARIKTALSTIAPRRSHALAPSFAFAVVSAAIVVAALLSMRPRAVSTTEHVPAPARPSELAPAATTPPPITVSRPARPRRAQARPAVLDLTPRAPTRIEFTAPEGTRILWFVGSPDAKELGS
jgi:hypothetical protein